jgi:hypothetical protein
MITAVILVMSALLSSILVAWGYYSNGLIIPAIILILIGIIWVFGQYKWVWFGSFGLMLVTIAAIAGIMLNFPVMPMITGIMFAFIAWDLVDFHNRLKRAGKLDDTKALESRHILRLGLILAAGWGVVLLTRIIRVRFNFEVSAFLVLAGVWGVSLLVGRLRNNE